jgi:RNA polymerase sigma factor (sigma-70 family)
MDSQPDTIFSDSAEQRKAFSIFFMRHYASTYAYLLRNTKDEALAKDLCQEAFVVLYGNRANFSNEKHMIGYLFRTAKYLFLNHMRKKRAYVRVSINPCHDIADSINTQEGPYSYITDVTKKLIAALEALSPRRKAIIEMRFLKELDVRTIASTLSISEQTVRNTLTQSLGVLYEGITRLPRKNSCNSNSYL